MKEMVGTGAEGLVEVALSKQLVLGEMLARNTRKFPDRDIIVFEGRRYSYKWFNERVNRLAHGLKALGIEKNDKVAVLSHNSPEMVETLFGLFKIGAVAVPLNFRMVAREMVYQIDNSDSKGLIFQGGFGDLVASMRSELDKLGKVRHYIRYGEGGLPGTVDYEGLIQKHSADEPLVVVDDEPAFIIYTSGTTGRPKGAVLTHKNVVATAANYCIEISAPRPLRGLLLYPLFHSGGLTTMMWWLFPGGTIVMQEETTAEAILRAIQDERITITSLVPALWMRIVNYPGVENFDLSSLGTAVTGAAPISREIKRRIAGIFPSVTGMYEAFGMTETSAAGVAGTPEDMLTHEKSLGRPTCLFEVRVVDDNDEDVAVGEVGEVVYRGPGVMKEYYNNPEATAESFKNGWFHSGDLVTRDEDGYLCFADRKKDMIISGGENIYPAEVEEVLFNHPKILEAAVIGVPDPDWGQNVKAVVVIKEGEVLTEEEVIEHCKQNLASYKKPKSVDFVDELPRSAQGKVLKYVLREGYAKSSLR